MDNFEMNNVSPYCCKYSYSSSSSSSSSSPSSSSSKSQQLVSSAAPPKKKAAGRKKFRETRHPVYRGVRQRNEDRWVCEVREPNKKTRIWLGTYPTPEMAARAHDAAVLALRGSSAIFNFPHSVSLLPIASSSSPADIRAAAAKAAETDYSSSSLFTTSTISSVRNSNGDGDNDDEYSRSMFFDEEALYNMPVLLDSMAEGLLMTPPSIKHAFDWDNNLQYDDHQSLTYLNLWTH